MIVSRTQLDTIAGKSLMDCHVKGLDSVMLDDTPGKRIRAYITRTDHEMWKNNCGVNISRAKDHAMSLAFHPHHCHLTLTPIFGDTWNTLLTPVHDHVKNIRRLHEYKYVSQITEGAGGFRGTGILRKFHVKWDSPLRESTYMDAKEIHTIFSQKDCTSAWFVHEHAEDPEYAGLNYSNFDLESWSAAELYKPMGVEYLQFLLDRMKIKVR